MTDRTDVARGRDIIARWCTLAEQRLDHLTELLETGRWRRYHSEPAFLENLQEAKTAVETWRGLLMREASRDNSAIDLSWLGRNRSRLPPAVYSRQPTPRLQPSEPPAKPLHAVSIVADAEPVVVDEVPSVPELAEAEVAEPVAALSLGMTAIQDRYPLLRNTL
jgi:uncharacterized repeat protein (TIGR03809 family)